MIAPQAIERSEFLQSLSRYIDREAQAETLLGLVLINVNNLGVINHSKSFGHGDAVIEATYSRLSKISKLPQTIFRVGGHHFVFILPGLSNAAFIALATNKILRELSAPIFYQGDSIDVDIQTGFSLDKERLLDAQGYLALAEKSLCQLKMGKSQLQLGSADNAVALDQHKLEQHFKEALYSNSFELYYQPKINLRTGKVDKAEALLRWNSPELGFVSPEVVVDLAEHLGKSFELTKWVMHTAVRQIKQWQDRLDIGIAINVQASMLAGPDLLILTGDALAIWGSNVDKLTLEITESAVIEDKDSGLDNLKKLRKRGVRLSIDDFGTGYSSLSYFKEIPAHELKIDKAFVMNMLSNQQDQDIVKIIVDIAHVFDLQVVAEGIEDEETLNHVISLGCDYGQGYFISRALPAVEFQSWCEQYPGLPTVNNGS